MNEAHGTASGWYPDPDGRMRYWDGAHWLDLPAPPPSRPPHWKTLLGRPIGWITAALLLLPIGMGIALKVDHDANVKRESAAAELAASEAAQRDADRLAAESADRERKEAAERSMRRVSIAQIEASIMEMAESHANSSLIDGPVVSVSCSPVGGGSVDDLLSLTTIFECFAATEEKADGSRSGYKYHATMNWDSETYTYGFGAP